MLRAPEAGSSSALPATHVGFTPVDLDRVPAVDTLLRRLGLGAFRRDSLLAPAGRNDVWAGPTESGRTVFVKRLVGAEPDVRARMRRLLSFERFAAALPSQVRHDAPLLGSDDAADLVVFEFLANSRNGRELVVDESFDNELAAATGRSIGLVHATVPADPAELDATAPPSPSLRLLDGLPQRIFDQSSFGELTAWRLMQSDDALVNAVAALREREERAPKVPAHCDLRIDQLLVVGDEVHLTDWEEFRLADAARDVGSFAGEWLYRSVLDIVTDRGDTVFADVELTHEMVLQRGVEKMQRLLPRVHHFWRAYREVRPEVDAEFTERATAFAGWHLLDRLIAAAARSARLSGIERAAAGIGRGAVLSPERFGSVLGFEVAA